MTVDQLLNHLAKMPKDAVVLMENGPGLSSISTLELIEAHGVGAPAEVLLHPSLED
jgi:hypothetical protein